MEKKTYDMRGRQANIARLRPFYNEGFIHMLFYRVLIFASVIYGVVLLLSLAYPQLALAAKVSTAIIWILFTPQLFETLKGFSLISSRGMAFGHLSEEYTILVRKKYGRNASVYAYVPYAAMVLWAIGFIAMLVWWSI